MYHTIFPDTGVVSPDVDVVGDVITDFATAAGDWPHHPAIVHNGTAISYRDLAERVRLAGLRYRASRFGTDGPSGLIGALVSHTPAAVEHLLGILQARATYCPIDAALPVGRKQAIAAVLGLDRLFAVAADPHEQADLRIETLDDHPAPADTELPQPLWQASDPAYVLCTSGSTGVPKPVVVSRRALTVTVRALRDLFALTREDRVLQFASLGWDTCLEEILPTLTGGATLVFDDEAQSGSFPRFVRTL